MSAEAQYTIRCTPCWPTLPS